MFFESLTLLTLLSAAPITALTGGGESLFPQPIFDLMALAPTGQLIATRERGEPGVAILHVRTGRRLRLLDKDHATSSFAFSPDGRSITIGTSKGCLNVWEYATGNVRLPLAGHNGEICSICYAKNGKTLASASNVDSLIYVWDLVSGKAIASYSFPSYNKFIVHNPSRSIDRQAAPVSADFPEYIRRIEDISMSGDGSALAVATWSNTIILIDVRTGKKAKTVTVPEKSLIKKILFSESGKYLAAATDVDSSVRVWEMPSATLIHTFKKHHGNSLAFSPDEGTLVSGGGMFHRIRVWDLKAGKKRWDLWKEAEEPIHGVAVSPDGKTLIAAGEGIRFYDLRSGKRLPGFQD